MATSYEREMLVETLQGVERGLEQALSERIRAGLATETLAAREGPAVDLHFEDNSAHLVGQLLVDVDRELRRTAAFLRQPERVSRTIERPEPGVGLEVVSATPGSFELFTLSAGAVAHVLSSDPVQAVITLAWFWEHRPTRWRRPKGVPIDIVQLTQRTEKQAHDALARGGSVEYHIRFKDRGAELEVDFRATSQRAKAKK